MERALHAGAIVGVKVTNAFGDVVDFCAADFFVEQCNFTVHKAGGGNAAEVNDDLQQFLAVVRLFHGMTDVCREDVQKDVEVVCDSMLCHMLSFRKRQGSSGVKSQSKGKDNKWARVQIEPRLGLEVKGGVVNDHFEVPAFPGCHAQSFACQASAECSGRDIIAGWRLTDG